MIVFGFAGMLSAVETNVLTLDPHLPAHWTRLSIPLTFHGNEISIDVDQREIQIINRGPSHCEVKVRDELRTIKSGENSIWAIR